MEPATARGVNIGVRSCLNIDSTIGALVPGARRFTSILLVFTQIPWFYSPLIAFDVSDDIRIAKVWLSFFCIREKGTMPICRHIENLKSE